MGINFAAPDEIEMTCLALIILFIYVVLYVYIMWQLYYLQQLLD